MPPKTSCPPDEAADIAGASRVTVNAGIDKGRCIGLTQTKRGVRVPEWQFEPRIWTLLPKLSAAPDTQDGWQLLAFPESLHGGLGGNTRRAAIEPGKGERGLAIAEEGGRGQLACGDENSRTTGLFLNT